MAPRARPRRSPRFVPIWASSSRRAGATWPYGKDPRDTNIRIAPSYPTVEDLEAALDVLVLAVKLVAAELARAERA